MITLDLPAFNKKAEILSFATVLTAHLRSPFNHVFALFISIQVLITLISTKI